MSTLTLAIVIVFVLGYLLIALESSLKVNKAAVALIMCVACWTLYMFAPDFFANAFHGADAGWQTLTSGSSALTSFVDGIIKEHLGDASETLFFLMGAMTIVEIVDSNGGFNFVRDTMQTKSKRALLWRIAFMTFFLSAILDNLTTSIVMVMVLRKLVHEQKDRLVYASVIIIAANSGGAFSPIGDVTTIMLWIGNMITTEGVIKEIFICSLMSLVVPAFILQYSLKGELSSPEQASEGDQLHFTKGERQVVFFLGVGGLIFVPIFRYLTDLPPFMGILLVLGLLWFTTELFYRNKHQVKDDMKKRVTKLLKRIDFATILFFLGILMAVACLQEVGVLKSLGATLDTASGGNYYLVTGIIGVVSSIVDNVPLVAACMHMYPVAETGALATDGTFWQLLAYCAGTGGSMLIIGSAAGVVVMGLEKITFGWYLKHISWIAFIGYLCGMLEYWVEKTYIFC